MKNQKIQGKLAVFMGNLVKNNKVLTVVIVLATIFMILMIAGIQAEAVKNGVSSTKVDGLQILKSKVTSTAKFYPVTANGLKMEVIAVKATDGTIRTAFNTCQVCYNSGRGFYTQQGDELVCNNCGNRFWIDKVEKIKNGCNPIPITVENKKDDGKYITIAKDFLASYSIYFKNWKR